MCNGDATESTVQTIQGGEETDKSDGGNESRGRKVTHDLSSSWATECSADFMLKDYGRV